MDEIPLTEDHVKKIVDDRLRYIGFDPQDTEEIRERIMWLKAKKRQRDNIVLWTTRAIVVSVITGIAYAIWEGIKIFLSKIHE